VNERRDCRPDLELARRASGGDEAAWREIYERTCDRLFALLCYQVGNREEALDLLQETYLRAFRRLVAYRGDAPIEAWLRVIALRQAIDWKRTILRRWKRTVELTESLVKVDPPAGEIHGDREREAMIRALGALSPPQRAALLLREWEDWSFREIAEALRCKEGTARVHHMRACARMRRILKGGPIRLQAGHPEGQST
jgi:RNA polymerase sigma factor (sigma-70 family)